MDSKTRELILSAWEEKKKTILHFKDIREFLEEKGILNKSEPRMTLWRWLEELAKKKDIEKIQVHPIEYKIIRNPEAFDVLNYLSDLREKYMSVTKETGEGDWRRSLLSCLGFKDKIELTFEDEKELFNLLAERLLNIFEALHLLRNVIVLRRAFEGTAASFPLFETIKREALLSMLCQNFKRENLTIEDLAQHFSLSTEIFSKNEGVNSKFDASSILKPFNYVNSVHTDWFKDLNLKSAYEDLEEKKERKRKYKLKNSKLPNLVKKYISFLNELPEQNFDVSPVDKSQAAKSFIISEEELKLRKKLVIYRIAILSEVADFIKTKDVNLDDFAVVLTRHKKSMSRNWTVEQRLHEVWEIIKATINGKPPNVRYELDQDFIKVEPLRYLAEVLADMHVVTEEFEKLKDKPWIRAEFGNDYEKFLRYYDAELKRELEELKSDI